jgi:hypothetical protein
LQNVFGLSLRLGRKFGFDLQVRLRDRLHERIDFLLFSILRRLDLRLGVGLVRYRRGW